MYDPFDASKEIYVPPDILRLGKGNPWADPGTLVDLGRVHDLYREAAGILRALARMRAVPAPMIEALVWQDRTLRGLVEQAIQGVEQPIHIGE